IRDFHVTGVQTCALPIFLLHFSLSIYDKIMYTKKRVPSDSDIYSRFQLMFSTGIDKLPYYIPFALSPLNGSQAIRVIFRLKKSRSEERRVGKECRCRMWP